MQHWLLVYVFILLASARRYRDYYQDTLTYYEAIDDSGRVMHFQALKKLKKLKKLKNLKKIGSIVKTVAVSQVKGQLGAVKGIASTGKSFGKSLAKTGRSLSKGDLKGAARSMKAAGMAGLTLASQVTSVVPGPQSAAIGSGANIALALAQGHNARNAIASAALGAVMGRIPGGAGKTVMNKGMSKFVSKVGPKNAAKLVSVVRKANVVYNKANKMYTKVDSVYQNIRTAQA
ncbi:hypothetical protein HDU91_000867, partial [Kappamyces sp. JEL0680]